MHSTLPTINQRDVFKKPRDGVRKIVIATNIAETSITIDDVVFVIDCGFLKMKKFDKKLNVSSLNTEWIAVSNARQRRGRAGRFVLETIQFLYCDFIVEFRRENATNCIHPIGRISSNLTRYLKCSAQDWKK